MVATTAGTTSDSSASLAKSYSMNTLSWFGFGVLLLVSEFGPALADHDPTLLYEWGTDAGDERFRNLFGVDYTSFPVDGDKFVLFGEEEDNVYVNPNGVVSFKFPFWFNDPADLPMEDGGSFIALYWADHDLRYADGAYFRVTNDEDLLRRAKLDIRANFPGCHDCFKPTKMLVATWSRVISFDFYYYADDYCDYYLSYYYNGEFINEYCHQYYEERIPDETSDGYNTYQVVLVTDGSDTYALFNYEEVTWIASDDGFAIVGFQNDEDTRFYQHPFSGDIDLLQLATEQTRALDVQDIWGRHLGSILPRTSHPMRQTGLTYHLKTQGCGDRHLSV